MLSRVFLSFIFFLFAKSCFAQIRITPIISSLALDANAVDLHDREGTAYALNRNRIYANRIALYEGLKSSNQTTARFLRTNLPTQLPFSNAFWTEYNKLAGTESVQGSDEPMPPPDSNPQVQAFLEAERIASEENLKTSISSIGGLYFSSEKPSPSSGFWKFDEAKFKEKSERYQKVSKEIDEAKGYNDFLKAMNQAIDSCQTDELSNKISQITFACYSGSNSTDSKDSCTNSPIKLSQMISSFSKRRHSGRKGQSDDVLFKKLTELAKQPEFQTQIENAFRDLSYRYSLGNLSSKDTPVLMTLALWETRTNLPSNAAQVMLAENSNQNSTISFNRDLLLSVESDINQMASLLRIISKSDPFDRELFDSSLNKLDSELNCYSSLNSGNPFPAASGLRRELIQLIVDREKPENCTCNPGPNSKCEIVGFAENILTQVLKNKSTASILSEDPHAFFAIWRDLGLKQGSLVKHLNDMAKAEWQQLSRTKNAKEKDVSKNRALMAEKREVYVNLIDKSFREFKDDGRFRNKTTVYVASTENEDSSQTDLYLAQNRMRIEPTVILANKFFSYSIDGDEVVTNYVLSDGKTQEYRFPKDAKAIKSGFQDLVLEAGTYTFPGGGKAIENAGKMGWEYYRPTQDSKKTPANDKRRY